MIREAYFIGIDLGSQGLRVVVVDTSGRIISSAGCNETNPGTAAGTEYE